MIGALWRPFARLMFAILFVLGGFLYAIPKWILVGTRGGRERRKTNKLLKQQNRLLRKQQRR
jgi:hypothetical protein